MFSKRLNNTILKRMITINLCNLFRFSSCISSSLVKSAVSNCACTLNNFHHTRKLSNCLSKHKAQQVTNIDAKLLPKHKETICALASGSGACGVAVIRISGFNAAKLCTLFMNPHAAIVDTQLKLPKPRYATYSKIYNPKTKGIIDTGLVLWFPGPSSFTGEDVIELQVHGSPAVVKCLLSAIVETKLARLAEAGEFTRRAFLNGKMDLTEVEALRDLLTAETDMQRQQALALSKGLQSRKLSEWLSQLSECTSLIDGHIEFGDTDDVTIDMTMINGQLIQVYEEMMLAIERSNKGMTIKSGINIALYGMTNVGKSSLLNALTSENRAIVSDLPNTTRDLIEVHMDLNGYAVNLIDTAGFYNDPAHHVETDAMNKSIELLFHNNTAVHILVIAADFIIGTIKQKSITVQQCLKQYVENMYVSGLLNDNPLNNVESLDKLFVKNTIVVLTKMDLVTETDKKLLDELLVMPNVISTSVVTNVGINQLMDECILKIKKVYSDFNPEEVQFNSMRLIEGIKKAASFVEKSINMEGSIDMKSQFMHSAIKCLSNISGRTYTNDILDDIFENFCVGK